jgi:hypothetical protein
MLQTRGIRPAVRTIPENLWPKLTTPSPLTLPHYLEQFHIVEQRLALLGRDIPELKRVLELGARFTQLEGADNKIQLVEQMFFSEELLRAMISGGEPYSPEPGHYIWQRLVDADLVRRVFITKSAFCDHQINFPLLLRYIGSRTFQNIFFPPSNLVPRYSEAIVAIDVELADGSQSRGTGFIAANDAGEPIIITCRHNVDPGTGICVRGISTVSGRSLDVTQHPMVSDSADLAALPLVGEAEEPLFRFADAAAIFDQVYTIGFPYIPRAEAAVVGHGGEINGFTELYASKTPALLISNPVSPGSSGCPVLDKAGFCVGMIFEWIEAEYGDQRARFAAALPAAVIAAFISS